MEVIAESSLLLTPADGEQAASGSLFTSLYKDLRRLASRQLSRSPAELTLDTTSLLHEAYLDMAGRGDASFADEGRFMAYAARVMRGLIIDYARGRKAQKRGGRFVLMALEGDMPDPSVDGEWLARVGASLDELAGIEPELARVVDLKFFCGFSFAEIAAMGGVSERTVQRQWEKARICLHRSLRDVESLQ